MVDRAIVDTGFLVALLSQRYAPLLGSRLGVFTPRAVADRRSMRFGNHFHSGTSGSSSDRALVQLAGSGRAKQSPLSSRRARRRPLRNVRVPVTLGRLCRCLSGQDERSSSEAASGICRSSGLRGVFSPPTGAPTATAFKSGPAALARAAGFDSPEG